MPMSDVHNDTIAQLMDAKKLTHRECVMYRTVSNDFTPEEVKTFDYDMLIFFSPSGIESLIKNFPDFKQGDIAIATFGPATAQALGCRGSLREVSLYDGSIAALSVGEARIATGLVCGRTRRHSTTIDVPQTGTYGQQAAD